MLSAQSTVITDGDSGFKFSTRRVTVSTAGLVPKLSDLGRSTSVNLAISLNATDDKKRSMLMPINRKYPIQKLMEACERYPLPNRRKITFEYILIKGVNDSEEEARRLIALLRPIKAKINLIPFNEHKGSEFKRPSDETVRNFQKILSDNGYTTIVRFSKGRDISAACGQLGAEFEHTESLSVVHGCFFRFSSRNAQTGVPPEMLSVFHIPFYIVQPCVRIQLNAELYFLLSMA